MKTLEERKAGATCSRCGQQRWPFKNWEEPYTCTRCFQALAGNGAKDPLLTVAQRAAGERLQEAYRLGKLPRSKDLAPGGAV